MKGARVGRPEIGIGGQMEDQLHALDRARDGQPVQDRALADLDSGRCARPILQIEHAHGIAALGQQES